MNIFSLSGLLIGILFVALGTLTLVKAKKSIHYIWAFFSFSVALWGFGSYKLGLAQDAASALWWWRVAYVGVILIPPLFTNFIIAFLELKKRWMLVFIYGLTGAFLIADFYNGFFIKDVSYLFGQFYYLSSPPFLYSVFVVMFVGLVVYGHVELFKAYKDSTGLKRSQIKYFLYATIPSFASGALEFLPVYKIELYPYLHIAIALSSITVTYAIFRYRLIDLRIVMRSILVYFASAAFVYGSFFSLVWLFEKYFGGVFTSDAYLTGLIIAPFFVIGNMLFYSFIQKTANKYLFYNLYNDQEAIAQLTDKLARSIDLGKIVNSIVNEIKEIMQLDRAGILLINQGKKGIKYEIAKVVGFDKSNGISLVRDNFLTRYLQQTQKPLVRDEIQMIAEDSLSKNDRQRFFRLAENMKHIEASLCLPMLISGKPIGMIVLGEKISGDAYTSDDLNLLNTLAQQASIAINNARLYQEVRDFNKTLEEKVSEQTKKIRGQKEQLERSLVVEKRAHELQKRANDELKKLDESKSDFMSITQHHLRTPLSTNAAIIDLVLSDAYGKMPDKMEKVIARLKDSNQKGIDVVNELLDVSSYQMGKEVIHPDKIINFPALMEETLKDLRVEAERKKIYLKYVNVGQIPKIMADRMKLKIVLTNVIDNCIKYTAKGGVAISVKAGNGKLLVTVTDTGIGLSNDVKEKLFKQTFERGEQAQRMFVAGKGLGLYLSGKIIEGHHGRIWAESRKGGKGSVFYIELPIKQKLSVKNNN